MPYRDFSYIRPPLPIAIQAALLDWIPGYGIAGGRWYFALQAAVILTVVFRLLRPLEPSVAPRALYAVLAVLCAFTGGFPPMPWHTVDGIFFSALATCALVAAVERRSLGFAAAAGLAAGAAALSKQGFAVLLLAGLGLALTPAGRRIGPRPWAGALAYVAGGAAIAAATAGYLAAHGALGAAVDAVFLAPREITREVLHRGAWDLAVRMHLPSLAGAAGSLVVLALVWPRMPDAARSPLLVGVLAALAGVWWAGRSPGLVYRFFLVEPLYAAVWLGGLGLLLAQVTGRRALAPSVAWALALSLCTLYGTTGSYLGIGTARIGLVLALPLVLLALAGGRPAADVAGRRAPRFAAGCLLLYAACLSAFIFVAVPHLDASRDELIVPFATERLSGIRSSALRVQGVDGVVGTLRRESGPGDYVLAFMDFPALYFLAERRNPTRVQWFLPQEVTRAEVARAVADLTARPPRLVVLSALNWIELGHPRLRPILGHLVAHYDEGELIGEFRIMRPRRPPAAG